MGIWSERVVPRLVDRVLSSAQHAEIRRRVCAGLTGEVLELGFGSGLNLPHLPAAVTTLTAVEPSDLAWSLSARRRARSRVPVVRAGLDGQRPTRACCAGSTGSTRCSAGWPRAAT